MVYHGTVRNGMVVFDEGNAPAEGSRVLVQPANGDQAPAQPAPGSLAERLLKLAGTAGPGLPRDLARNHDHYLHGAPKR